MVPVIPTGCVVRIWYKQMGMPEIKQTMIFYIRECIKGDERTTKNRGWFRKPGNEPIMIRLFTYFFKGLGDTYVNLWEDGLRKAKMQKLMI